MGAWLQALHCYKDNYGEPMHFKDSLNSLIVDARNLPNKNTMSTNDMGDATIGFPPAFGASMGFFRMGG